MKKIGRYEIEAEIGRGAMGVVFLARDPRLQREVAVKTYFLPAELSTEHESEFRERFKREAQAAARLSHPGIVTVYDVDEDVELGQPFICMEYVLGSTLDDRLERQGPLEVEQALEIVGLLAEALDVAHNAGIVHRDIKPANIILRAKDDAPKLADFGVAHMSTSDLTRSGSTFGSPAYMAPEQIRGEIVDGRSDLFSLAVVVYECLCGERPFAGDDPTAVAHSIVYEAPIRITRRVSGLPGGLDPLFDRALAKEPARRFSNASEFATAFERAVRDPWIPEVEATAVVATPGVSAPNPNAWHTGTDSRPAASVGDPGGASLAFSGSTGGLFRWGRQKIIGVVGLGLALLLVGWIWLGPQREAYLKLDGKSSVKAGTLSLQIDGTEVYTRELSSPHTKRNFIKKMFDQRHETFEAWIEVSPGKHEIAALVVPHDAAGFFQDTIVVDLEPGETRRLRMVAGRSFGSVLSLKID